MLGFRGRVSVAYSSTRTMQIVIRSLADFGPMVATHRKHHDRANRVQDYAKLARLCGYNYVGEKCFVTRSFMMRKELWVWGFVFLWPTSEETHLISQHR